MGRKATSKPRINNPQKRAQLAERAFPLFQTQGLRNITMDEVATYVGKSKATIYKYFSSREAIISSALSQRLAAIKAFEHILNDTKLPYLQRYFDSINHLHTQLGDISTLFLADLKYLFPNIWKLISQLIDEVSTLLQCYYKEGIERKIFNAINVNLLLLSDKFFFTTLSDPDFLQKNQLTIQVAFAQYFELKFIGLLKDTKAYQHHFKTN